MHSIEEEMRTRSTLRVKCLSGKHTFMRLIETSLQAVSWCSVCGCVEITVPQFLPGNDLAQARPEIKKPAVLGFFSSHLGAEMEL